MRVKKLRRALLASFILENRQKKRCFAVHEINKSRKQFGTFYTLMPQLCADPEKFFNYVRMYPEQFNEVLEKVCPLIERPGCNWNEPISAEQCLVVMLR